LKLAIRIQINAKTLSFRLFSWKIREI